MVAPLCVFCRRTKKVEKMRKKCLTNGFCGGNITKLSRNGDSEKPKAVTNGADENKKV